MEKIVQYIKNINVLSQMINSFVGFAFQKDTIDPHINFVISEANYIVPAFLNYTFFNFLPTICWASKTEIEAAGDTIYGL